MRNECTANEKRSMSPVRPGDGSVIIRSYTEIMKKEKMITEPSPGHTRFPGFAEGFFVPFSGVSLSEAKNFAKQN